MTAAPRIVCLSAEAADWFWRIGAWENVVGTTAYFNPPPNASPKPRVSGFSSANLEQIEKLKPDLVVTFSDVQSDLAKQLIHRSLAVLATNQRTLAEIEATLTLLARVVDREAAAIPWLQQFREQLAPVTFPGPRPRIYFEEWDEPHITGIAWVSELIERAGGDDIFPRLAVAARRPGTDCYHPTDSRRRPGNHHRFVVRQTGPNRRHRGPKRMAKHRCLSHRQPP